MVSLVTKLSETEIRQQAPQLLRQIARTADYSKLPMTDVTIYSNIDSTCCPPGKSVISSLFVASEETFPDEERAYQEKKVFIKEQFMLQIARALDIPDLTNHVEVVEVATPITLKRFLQGTVKGHSWDGELLPSKAHFQNYRINRLSRVCSCEACGVAWVVFQTS